MIQNVIVLDILNLANHLRVNLCKSKLSLFPKLNLAGMNISFQNNPKDPNSILRPFLFSFF